MYLDFYGLRQKPFSLQPDPEFLFFSKRHRSAMEAMQYSTLNCAPIVVITGDIGAGKTTLIRHFFNNLEQDTTVGLISHTHENFGSLMKLVLSSFNFPYSGLDLIECYDLFVEFLLSEYSKGRKVVLIVDEAQNLNTTLLEELRLLTNINSEKDQLLQVILVGQPQLEKKLKRQELVQFAQRISLHYHLSPLLLAEVQNYIRHRLRIAGGMLTTFDSEAIGTIAYHSGGIPRVINSICEMALVYGYANSLKRINKNIINDVFKDSINNQIYFEASPLEKPQPV